MKTDLKEILHDVSELEAPTPLTSTLEKIKELQNDEVLHMIHRMEPCVLFDALDQNGYEWEMEKNDQVHIWIWRKTS